MDGVSTHVADFCAYMLEVRAFSLMTVKSYRSDLRQLEGFLREKDPHVSVEDHLLLVTPECLSTFVDHTRKGRMPNTTDRRIAAIRSFYRWLWKVAGRIQTNPSLHLRILGLPMSRVHVSTQRIAQVMNEMEVSSSRELREYVIARLIHETGMRIGEALALNRNEIATKPMIVLRPFHPKEREVQISDGLRELLEKYVSDTADPSDTVETALFLNKHRERISSRSVRRYLRQYKITPRLLRMGFIQTQRQAGMKDEAIATKLGLNCPFSLSHIQPCNESPVTLTLPRGLSNNPPVSPNGKLKAVRKIVPSVTPASPIVVGG